MCLLRTIIVSSADKNILSEEFLLRILKWSSSRPIDRMCELTSEDYDFIWKTPTIDQKLIDEYQYLHSSKWMLLKVAQIRIKK